MHRVLGEGRTAPKQGRRNSQTQSEADLLDSSGHSDYPISCIDVAVWPVLN
jgi:hypothetical protein